MANDKIRVSFEMTKHEAAITAHWIAKQTIMSYPVGSIAKAMHNFYKALQTELAVLKEREDNGQG